MSEQGISMTLGEPVSQKCYAQPVEFIHGEYWKKCKMFLWYQGSMVYQGDSPPG